ncbi:MAG: histidine phosphatase family protein [Chloroflexi bacterium]|nr:histidine phosphatase family protein [Chloroflexota bacterium]MCL5273760.1 histidine phosphatase family protein [Chloroflexota bacterium]
MRYLEVRRHSVRVKPGKHLSQAGVVLARRSGEGTGPFDRVVTSDPPRAYETAIAMGYAVDEQMKELASFDDEVDAEISSDPDMQGIARAVRKGKAAARQSKRMAKLWHSIVEGIPDGGRVLVITHGTLLELGAIGCLPDADHAAWGAAFDYCEGVRLSYDGAAFTDLVILRNA